MEQQVGNHVNRKPIVHHFLNILKFIGFLVMSSFPLLIISFLLGLEGDLSTALTTVLGILYIVLVIGFIRFLWKKYKGYSNNKIQSVKMRDIGFIFMFFLIVQVSSIIGTILLNVMYGKEDSANQEALIALTETSTSSHTFFFILFVLSISIFIPIIEELVFRGIGKSLLFHKSIFWLPMIITSTIFGLMHGPTDMISFLLYGSMGIIFFISYYRRRNILDSILVHTLNNSLASIFIFL